VTGGSGGASAFGDPDEAALAPRNDLLRHLTAIWHIRDEVPLPPGLSGEAALARIEPLFAARGTQYDRRGETLTFTKRDPAAQDRMAVFDSGVLRIEAGELGPVLRYHLVGRMLLFCFLMPLVFLGFAQAAIFLGKSDKPPAEATAKPGEKAKPEKKEPELKLNPIDEFLGAPAPEKPDKDKDKKKKKDEKDAKAEKKPSPTPAYVFAGIFAALYLIGRVLEAWLVKRLFRRRLWGG